MLPPTLEEADVAVRRLGKWASKVPNVDYAHRPGDLVVMMHCYHSPGVVVRLSRLSDCPSYDIAYVCVDKRGRRFVVAGKFSEGLVESLSAFLARHAEHGTDYDEVMKSLRSKWEAQREYNTKVRLGYMMGDGAGI